jgi:hypothetical protein
MDRRENVTHDGPASGSENKALYPVSDAGSKQIEGPLDICFQVNCRVFNRLYNIRMRGQMNDRMDSGHSLIDHLRIPDIPLDEIHGKIGQITPAAGPRGP